MTLFKIYPIDEKSSETLIEDFVSFPFKVRDPVYQAGLTPKEHAKKLIHWGLQNGSTFWLIKDQYENEVIRISFRISKAEANTATIGFFEADLSSSFISEAFDFTIREIENELKGFSVKTIYAPIDLNTWFNYRFSLPSKNTSQRYDWEPTTPPEYLELFQTLGYKKTIHFNSVFFRNLRIGPYAPGTGHMKSSYKRIVGLNYTLRPFRMDVFLEQEVPLFHRISHEAFSDAFLFEPIDLDTFRALYAGAKTNYDFSPSCVLISPEGETAGFLFAFFDKDVLVIKSIALLQKYQGLKLSSGMIYSAVKMAFKKNKRLTVSALVRTGLKSEKIAGNSQKWAWLNWSHDYVLVKKDLA